jgi:hypothetical protein
MRIAYLILAHNNPKHLQRLITALSSNSSACFIHIDCKSDLEIFSGIHGDNVYFAEKRTSVYWGDFSQVTAILFLLKMALSQQTKFDYFVLISGTDFPLKSAAGIENFFERNSGTEFINMVQMPCEAMGKPISRLTTYRVRPSNSKFIRMIRKGLAKLDIMPKQRNYESYLRNLTPYGGSTWWSLSREACEYIQAFVNRETRVVNFFKNTICPDESFFQTILGNSPYRDKVSRNLTYTDWSEGGGSPASLTEQHLQFFAENPSIVVNDGYGTAEVLFARKFSDSSQDIVIELERLIRQREESLNGNSI